MTFEIKLAGVKKTRNEMANTANGDLFFCALKDKNNIHLQIARVVHLELHFN